MRLTTTLAVSFFVLPLASNTAANEYFKIPEYVVNDYNHVNYGSGSIYHTQPDVSIGGKLGIQHSVSNGAIDSFFGILKDTHMGQGSSLKTFLQISGPVSAKFTVESDGSLTPHDAASKLEFVQNVGYVLTTANGTIATFGLTTANTEPKPFGNGPYRNSDFKYALLTEVLYPNGFKVNIEHKNRDAGAEYTMFGYITNVSTNTNFQLKYNYNIQSGYQWSKMMPTSVVGINSAVEYCDADAVTCELVNEWPQAKYSWPQGMPNVMLTGPTTYRMTNPQGGNVEYYFDLRQSNTYEDCGMLEPITDVKLVGIKELTSTVQNITYTYRDDPGNRSCAERSAHFIKLNTSVSDQGTLGYDFNEPISNAHATIGTGNFGGGDYQQIDQVLFNGSTGVIDKVSSWKQLTILEQSFRNKVKSVSDNLTKDYSEYSYDARGNLTKIETWAHNGTSRATVSTVREAGYPVTCDNIKVCNQPSWTSDAKGNVTDYTYHTESGQVATIKKPANEHGIRPHTRYSYEQKFAAGSSDGIYLLATEKYCINSNYNGTACVANDEVVVSYEYENNNLFMIGKVVTGPGGASLRTCYRYDIYGNLIGETKPKANLASCAY
ncbi:hypothetical protein P2G88_01065 [Aliiglaciecola sp. CAU 1673]|uniref:hypothetical protein n=1 Tax=Aliiglaciecola sp. CAU 1673 TaxID=3032595 RepID=UPI0023D9D9A9|nr:hypothetical protein [Aliiglaciecola sp. CAU 1673]MDF2176840.1 hypothetical protein [Aliiglaciecola sp. CAU 1673]